jgi:hypothetical protein
MTLEEIIAEAQARRAEFARSWREREERNRIDGFHDIADRCAGFAAYWELEPAWTAEGAA